MDKSDVIQYIEKIEGGMQTPKNGWHQFKACPICGSDSGFAILVDPEDSKDPEAPPGVWACRSTKHGAAPSGSFKTLLRLTGADVDAIDPHPVKQMKITQNLEFEEPSPIMDMGKGYIDELRNDQDSMDWMEEKFGLGKKDVVQLGLGLSLKDKRKKLIIPYFYKGRPVMYKLRNIRPLDKKDRGFVRYPTNVPELVYNVDALFDMIDENNPKKTLFICEGESDVWTLKKLIGINAPVIGLPGANNIPQFLPTLLKDIEPGKHPRICLVPDKDAAASKMVTELVRRTGAKYLMVLNLPEHPDRKDITDWAIAEKWDLKEFKVFLQENTEAAAVGNSRHVFSVIKSLVNSTRNEDKGLRFYSPGMDSMLATPYAKHDHLHAGKTSLLMGPRKHRKTTLALIAGYKTARSGVPGCFFTVEQRAEDVGQMLFEPVMGREPTGMKDYEMLLYNMRHGSGCDLWITSQPQISIKEFREYIAAGVAAHGWKWIIIDSLTALAGIGQEALSTAMSWARSFQQATLEHGIHAMFLAHVTGDNRYNPNYRKPLRADDIHYFKTVLSVVDYQFIIQCKERPGHGDNTLISACSLFQQGLVRGKARGAVELLWDDCQRYKEVPHAFYQNYDADPDGVGDDELDVRAGVLKPKWKDEP